MAITMQQILDRARPPLNDSDKVRYPDAVLITYANAAIYTLRSKRPDLFFGSFSALPSELVVGTTFPLPDEYSPAVQDYVTARAQTVDNEEVLKERAAAFFALFAETGVK